jgi:hypothetical protein
MALQIEAEIFAADMAGSHMERQLERILTVLERQEEIKVKEDALPTGKASKDFQDSSTKASVEITFTFTKAPISETISSPSIADDSAEKRTSSAAAPVILRPVEPSHPPPQRVMTRIDLESRLRRELVATTGRGEFDGADANVDGLTGEVLSLCIGVCKTETNRDTILWIVDSSLSPDLQQKNGIRISIRYRGYIRSSVIPVPTWMKQSRWLRTTFMRRRGSSDNWTLFENRAELPHGASFTDCEI